MNIIFLDIDGVLNSVDSAIAFYEWMPKGTREQSEDKLDKVSIGLLRKLCMVTDAKIVISSTWRMGRVKEDFEEIFKRYGWVDFPYYGQTIIGYILFDIGSRTRGHEIQHWLKEHPEIINYAIIDDDSDMLPNQLKNFVHVSNINGFRSKHYCQCLRLLGKPDEVLERQVNWVKTHEKIVMQGRNT